MDRDTKSKIILSESIEIFYEILDYLLNYIETPPSNENISCVEPISPIQVMCVKLTSDNWYNTTYDLMWIILII